MPVNNQFEWLKTNKFYMYTPIAGFSFISATNRKPEIVTWYLVIIIFSAMTISNLYILIREYTSGQTVTSVTIGTENDLPYVPSLFVDISIRFPFVNSDFNPKSNGTIPFNIKTLRDELAGLFGDLKSKVRFLNETWPYSLLLSFIHYYSNMYMIEKWGRSSLPVNKWPITPKMEEFLWQDKPNMMAGMYAYNHSVILGVLPDELYAKFTIEMIDLVGLKVTTGWMCRSMSFSRLESEHKIGIHWLAAYESKVAMTFGIWPTPPPNSPCKFKHRKDYMTVTADLQKRDHIFMKSYQVSFEEYINNAMFDQSRFVRKIMVVEPSNTGTTASGATAYFGSEPTAHELGVSSLFKSIVKSELPCSPGDRTKLSCAYSCIRKDLHERCQCNPFWFKQHHSQENATNHCSLEKYLICNETLRYQYEAWENCREACLDPCNHARFSFKSLPLDASATGAVIGPNQASLHLYNLSNTEFPIFTEEPAQSWQSFMAEVGGTLDFYLGCTVIGILHLIVYGVKQIVYAFTKGVSTGVRSRKPTKHTANERGTSMTSFTINKCSNGVTPIDTVTSMAEISESLIRLQNVAEQLSEVGRSLENLVRHERRKY